MRSIEEPGKVAKIDAVAFDIRLALAFIPVETVE